MTDHVKCQSCGAANPAGAPWCNQCFTSFGPPPAPAPPDAPPVAPEPAVAAPSDLAPGDAGSETSAAAVEAAAATLEGSQTSDSPGEEPVWQCQVCDTANPLSSNVCAVCRTPIFVSFGAETEQDPGMSASEAAVQAFVPGLAHIRMGHGLIGFTIALLVWVLIGFALIIAFAGGAPLPVLLVFLVAVGIILVSVHDAQRIAQRQPQAVLLKPRTLTFVALGAIALVVAIIWIQGLSGAASSTTQ